MSSDHEAEIRASVAAHADLGPGYDDAVAEGLVERIGAEIDKRIDARLGQFGPPGFQMGPPPVRPSSVGQRNVATTITALGSMALGVGATAIVSHAGNSGARAFMVLLIWAAIAIVNVAYARRH